MISPRTPERRRFLSPNIRLAVALLPVFAFLFLYPAESASAATTGQWDEVVGKDIRTSQGQLIGVVKDSIVDLENGRYVGILVGFGGVAGIGEKTRIIPPSVLQDKGVPRTLYLNMDADALKKAPVFDLPRTGPPDPAKVAAVYRYFGQSPYFFSPGNESSSEHLGHLRRGHQIILMPVENLQGVPLGSVMGLRALNRMTGRLGGVVITPLHPASASEKKVVVPQALRYNLKHNALRINDHEQAFKDAPGFNMDHTWRYVHDDPNRPGVLPPPLAQGASESDRAITEKISKQVLSAGGLSNYGQNIQVTTLDGKVTLRGRTVNDTNHARLIAIAVGAAGAGNVVDLIEVEPMTEAERNIDR